jgi:hypothetical protein
MQVPARSWLRAGLQRLTALCLGALLAASAVAAPRFEIRNAFAEPVEGVWQLNAIIDLGLSPSAREALAQGIPLTLVLDVVVTRERRLLPDDTVAELQQRWKLAFDALSERYVVVNENSGAQASYADRDEAIAALAHIRKLPMIDADLLEAGVRHEVSLRASVEIGGLSDAMKMLFFWRDWGRSTSWYTWSIRP